MIMANILIVEDNPMNMILIKDILEMDGHKVFEAWDGVEGVEKAKDLKPDFILMDINMPLLDGYGAVKQIRETESIKDTIVIAVTASVMTEEVEKILDAGFSGYLAKPIDRKDLIKTLNANL